MLSGECFSDSWQASDVPHLENADGQFRPHWLIRLYEREGEPFVEQLNGLFSGLLIDTRKNRSLLFLDRYGLERIYWHESKDARYFASEATALLRVLPELKSFDSAGVTDFLTFGCPLEWRTLFKGIELLPAGTCLRLESDLCRKRTYFSPEAWESQATLSPGSFGVALADTFARILPRYFHSDSRLGISLTGGIDTRMIMANLPHMCRQPVCYTFTGSKGKTLDDRLAARVAKTCGVDHQLLRLHSDFLSDFGRHVDRTVYATEVFLERLVHMRSTSTRPRATWRRYESPETTEARFFGGSRISSRSNFLPGSWSRKCEGVWAKAAPSTPRVIIRFISQHSRKCLGACLEVLLPVVRRLHFAPRIWITSWLLWLTARPRSCAALLCRLCRT